MAEPPYVLSPFVHFTGVHWNPGAVFLFFFSVCDDRARDDSDDNYNMKVTWEANIEGETLTMLRLHEQLTQNSPGVARWVKYVPPEPETEPGEPEPDPPPEVPRPDITEDITADMKSWYTAFLMDTHVQDIVRLDLPDVPYKADRVAMVVFPHKLKKDGPNWDVANEEYVFDFPFQSGLEDGQFISNGKIEFCCQVVSSLSWLNRLGVEVAPSSGTPNELAVRDPGKPEPGKPNNDYEGGDPLLDDEAVGEFRQLTFTGTLDIAALKDATPLSFRLKKDEDGNWHVTQNSWDDIG